MPISHLVLPSSKVYARSTAPDLPTNMSQRLRISISPSPSVLPDLSALLIPSLLLHPQVVYDPLAVCHVAREVTQSAANHSAVSAA